MYTLKKAVFHAFPSFWNSPLSFEAEWKLKCWPAIEQACRRLRRIHERLFLLEYAQVYLCIALHVYV